MVVRSRGQPMEPGPGGCGHQGERAVGRVQRRGRARGGGRRRVRSQPRRAHRGLQHHPGSRLPRGRHGRLGRGRQQPRHRRDGHHRRCARRDGHARRGRRCGRHRGAHRLRHRLESGQQRGRGEIRGGRGRCGQHELGRERRLWRQLRAVLLVAHARRHGRGPGAGAGRAGDDLRGLRRQRACLGRQHQPHEHEGRRRGHHGGRHRRAGQRGLLLDRRVVDSGGRPGRVGAFRRRAGFGRLRVGRFCAGERHLLRRADRVGRGGAHAGSQPGPGLPRRPRDPGADRHPHRHQHRVARERRGDVERRWHACVERSGLWPGRRARGRAFGRGVGHPADLGQPVDRVGHIDGQGQHPRQHDRVVLHHDPACGSDRRGRDDPGRPQHQPRASLGSDGDLDQPRWDRGDARRAPRSGHLVGRHRVRDERHALPRRAGERHLDLARPGFRDRHHRRAQRLDLEALRPRAHQRHPLHRHRRVRRRLDGRSRDGGGRERGHRHADDGRAERQRGGGSQRRRGRHGRGPGLLGCARLHHRERLPGRGQRPADRQRRGQPPPRRAWVRHRAGGPWRRHVGGWPRRGQPDGRCGPRHLPLRARLGRGRHHRRFQHPAGRPGRRGPALGSFGLDRHRGHRLGAGSVPSGHRGGRCAPHADHAGCGRHRFGGAARRRPSHPGGRCDGAGNRGRGWCGVHAVHRGIASRRVGDERHLGHGGRRVPTPGHQRSFGCRQPRSDHRPLDGGRQDRAARTRCVRVGSAHRFGQGQRRGFGHGRHHRRRCRQRHVARRGGPRQPARRFGQRQPVGRRRRRQPVGQRRGRRARRRQRQRSPRRRGRQGPPERRRGSGHA